MYSTTSQEPICPYNVKNKLITCIDVETLIKRYSVDVEINNVDLFIQAFTHKSYIGYNDPCHANKCPVTTCKCLMSSVKLLQNSYERLEYLGDSVIKSIISNYLFDRYPDENEGFMTKLKTKIENKVSLAKLSIALGLDEYMIISSQIEDSVGRKSEKILEDVFESFFGALFKTTSMSVCNELMISIMENEVDFSGILHIDTNYKDQLLRFYHKNKWGPPTYKSLYTSGTTKKEFTMGVMNNNGVVIAQGTDTSKRKAEQEASRNALLLFNQLQHEVVEKDSNILEFKNTEQILQSEQR